MEDAAGLPGMASALVAARDRAAERLQDERIAEQRTRLGPTKPISIEAVRRAAKTFRWKRAVSVDNLRPRHVTLLSSEALSTLARILALFERFLYVGGW